MSQPISSRRDTRQLALHALLTTQPEVPDRSTIGAYDRQGVARSVAIPLDERLNRSYFIDGADEGATTHVIHPVPKSSTASRYPHSCSPAAGWASACRCAVTHPRLADLQRELLRRTPELVHQIATPARCKSGSTSVRVDS